MKKKKYIIWITTLICVIAVICLVVALVVNNKNEAGEDDEIILSQTTEEERIFWNDFLQEHPFTAEIEYIYSDKRLMEYSELIKIALSSDNVKAEEISDEEKKENILLTADNAYKKSKKEVDSYLKKYFGVEEIEYNLVRTYVVSDEFLILGEDYIYYTEITLPEKAYIATKYEQKGEDYTVEINEYIVTKENREKLNSMLKTGEITEDVQMSNNYTITGKKTDDNVQIISKYPNKEGAEEMDEMPEELPEGVEIVK